MRFSTLKRAYNSYANNERVVALRPLSYSSFTALLYSWAIPPTPYDPYACPHCYIIESKKPDSLTEKEKLHSKALGKVWTEYKSHIAQLQSGSADFILILIDYSRVHELDSVKLVEGGREATLSILNWTIVYPGDHEEHYDYFSNAKQGEAFLFSSMVHMAETLKLKLKGVEKIMVWSDGGFKNYGTVCSWRWLYDQLRVPIFYRFFVAYHGHNRCDGHFGRGKIELRKRYADGRKITTEMVIGVFEGLKNSHTKLMKKIIEPEPGKWTFKGATKGVRSWDGIRIDEHGIAKQTINDDYPNDFTQIDDPEFEQAFQSSPVFRVKPQRPIDHNWYQQGIHTPPGTPKPYATPLEAYAPLPSRAKPAERASASIMDPPSTVSQSDRFIPLPRNVRRKRHADISASETDEEPPKRKTPGRS